MIAGSWLELGLAVIYGQSVLQVPYSFFFFFGGGGNVLHVHILKP